MLDKRPAVHNESKSWWVMEGLGRDYYARGREAETETKYMSGEIGHMSVYDAVREQP